MIYTRLSGELSIERILNSKLDEFISLMKLYEEKNSALINTLVTRVQVQIEGFLNKRKNIFNVLQIDINDKAKVSSFNK